MGLWSGLTWLRIGAGGGACECGNETSGSTKCGEFFDYLRTGYFVRKNSALWSK